MISIRSGRVYKNLGYGNNEINYPFRYNGESIYPFDITEDFLEEYHRKRHKLLEWEVRMVDVEMGKINENRRLLVEAMVYLYMSSDVKIQSGVLEIIQIYVKKAFGALQTPPISCFKNTINSRIDSHIHEQFGLNGGLEMNDTLAEEMIKDLMKRVKNRENGQKKRFKKLPNKIRLQNEEDSLTARYVLLQRLMIRMLAISYGILEF